MFKLSLMWQLACSVCYASLLFVGYACQIYYIFCTFGKNIFIMKIEEIEKSINTKYKKLLSEIERKNKFIFTNKENGLVVRVNILDKNFSKEPYFVKRGQDFFKISSFVDAVKLFSNLGFDKEKTEDILNAAFYETHRHAYDNSEFYLGFYILEAVSCQ